MSLSPVRTVRAQKLEQEISTMKGQHLAAAFSVVMTLAPLGGCFEGGGPGLTSITGGGDTDGPGGGPISACAQAGKTGWVMWGENCWSLCIINEQGTGLVPADITCHPAGLDSGESGAMTTAWHPESTTSGVDSSGTGGATSTGVDTEDWPSTNSDDGMTDVGEGSTSTGEPDPPDPDSGSGGKEDTEGA